MSLERPLWTSIDKLKKLPDMPKFFCEGRVKKEYNTIRELAKFSDEQIIWNLRNFYYKLKIACLFSFKLLQPSFLNNSLSEYSKTQIDLALKAIDLPTLFFAGNESQTAALIFVDPINNFFLQYTITTIIDIEELAQVLSDIFAVDEHGNISGIKNQLILNQNIKNLTDISMAVDKILVMLKEAMFYADSADNEDHSRFYIDLYKEYKLNNSLESYLNPSENPRERFKKYLDDVAQVKASETLSSDSDDSLDSDEQISVGLTQGELTHAIESSIKETEEEFKKDLEEHYFGLINAEMSVFHTFKNNLNFPGVINQEIVEFLANYEVERENKFAAKKMAEKKTKAKLGLELKDTMESLKNEIAIAHHIGKVQQMDESDPRRIRICRDYYYEITDIIHCLFYILKNLAEKKLINRNDKLNEIIDKIIQAGPSANNAELKRAKAQSAKVIDKKPASTIKKKKVTADDEKKDNDEKPDVPNLIITGKDKPKPLTTKSEPVVVIDVKEQFAQLFAECYGMQTALDEKFDLIESEHNRIYIALGAVSDRGALDRKLAEIFKTFKSNLNIKNRIKADARKNLDKEHETPNWNEKLIKWKAELNSLLTYAQSALKKMDDIQEKIIILQKPKATRKKQKLTEKIQATKLIRARTQSEYHTRDRDTTPLTLTRRSSDSTLNEVKSNLFDNQGVESVATGTSASSPDNTPNITPASTPGLTPRPSPSSRNSVVYELGENDEKILLTSTELSRQDSVPKSKLRASAPEFTPKFSSSFFSRPNLPPLKIEDDEFTVSLEPIVVETHPQTVTVIEVKETAEQPLPTTPELVASNTLLGLVSGTVPPLVIIDDVQEESDADELLKLCMEPELATPALLAVDEMSEPLKPSFSMFYKEGMFAPVNTTLKISTEGWEDDVEVPDDRDFDFDHQSEKDSPSPRQSL